MSDILEHCEWCGIVTDKHNTKDICLVTNCLLSIQGKPDYVRSVMAAFLRIISDQSAQASTAIAAEAEGLRQQLLIELDEEKEMSAEIKNLEAENAGLRKALTLCLETMGNMYPKKSLPALYQRQKMVEDMAREALAAHGEGK